MYHYSFNSAGRGAIPFLISFALEPEIVTLAWIDNAAVQFPLNIYATKGLRRPLAQQGPRVLQRLHGRRTGSCGEQLVDQRQPLANLVTRQV